MTSRSASANACCYPLVDGPGIALLVFFPPVLWLMSLPIFDVIAFLEPLTRGNWALGLLVLPILLPMLISFALVLGYALLFLGQVLVSSAMGDPDHPRWPEWDRQAISEGLGRWMWAGVVGLVVGGFPVALYWKYCGDIDWFDRIVFAELVILGVGYAQLALAASLLHDSLVAANPLTVLLAVARLGWDYVQPCLTAGHRPDPRGGCARGRALRDAQPDVGRLRPLGVLGLRALRGHGRLPDARPDVLLPRRRARLVPPAAEVGAPAALRPHLSNS